MKTNPVSFITSLVLLAGTGAASVPGTAFMYQGRLNDGDGPVNGTYDNWQIPA